MLYGRIVFQHHDRNLPKNKTVEHLSLSYKQDAVQSSQVTLWLYGKEGKISHLSNPSYFYRNFTLFLPAYFPIFHSNCFHKNVDSDNHVINFAIDKCFGLADKLSCCLERNTVVDREGEASSAIISANDWS